MWSTGGATEEDYYCIQDMGLSQQDGDGIAAGHAITMQGVMDAVVANNGFAWPLLSGREASLDLADPRPKCAATLRAQCKGSWNPNQNKTLQYGFTRKAFHDAFPLPFPEQDVAMFMLTRGPYAYIGHSWMVCVHPSGYVTGNSVKGYERPLQLDVDYGEPVALKGSCTETVPGKSGIFTREWTKADVQMDCNTWQATIKMK